MAIKYETNGSAGIEASRLVHAVSGRTFIDSLERRAARIRLAAIVYEWNSLGIDTRRIFQALRPVPEPQVLGRGPYTTVTNFIDPESVRPLAPVFRVAYQKAINEMNKGAKR